MIILFCCRISKNQLLTLKKLRRLTALQVLLISYCSLNFSIKTNKPLNPPFTPLYFILKSLITILTGKGTQAFFIIT